MANHSSSDQLLLKNQACFMCAKPCMKMFTAALFQPEVTKSAIKTEWMHCESSQWVLNSKEKDL
jgi:hypothetical protein